MRIKNFILSLITLFILFGNFRATGIRASNFNIIDSKEVQEAMLFQLSGEELRDLRDNSLAVSKHQEFTSHLSRQRSTLLSESYAGSFIDVENRLNVMFVNLEQLIPTLSGWKDVVFHEATYSESELEFVYQEIVDIMYGVDYDITAAYVNIEKNVVMVEVINVTDEEQKEILSRVSNSNIIRFEQKTENDRIQASFGISGGTGIGFTRGGCSVGFRARRNGIVGVTSAAHCGSVNETVNHNGVDIGSVTASVFSGNTDALFIELYPGFTAKPWASFENYRYQYITANSDFIVQGQQITRIGITSGLEIGYISNVSVTIPLLDVYLTDQLELSFPSDRGDSGGIILGHFLHGDDPVNYAIGTSAATTTTNTYVTKSSNAMSSLGLTNY